MPGPSKEVIILHDEFSAWLLPLEESPLPWKAQLVRKTKEETPALRFQAENVSAFEKRYLESIDQRVRLAEAAAENRNGPALSFSYDIDGSCAELNCSYTDGEPLLEFVSRQKKLESGSAINLLLDLVSILSVYVEYPRVLSNIRLEDFIIYAEDGIRLRARLRIANALLKSESPMSDFHLWEFWRDELTRLASKSLLFANNESRRDCKHRLSAFTRKLSSLFKSFRKHSELNLFQKFEQLESLLRNELKDFEEKSVTPYPKILTEFEFPRTSITNLIRSEYAKDVSKAAPCVLTYSQTQESFSGFVSFGSSSTPTGPGNAVIYFTTPGHWFSHSVIETINRKMTTPFLKTHHNGIRIRSIACETAYTCLISDEKFGIPLPSLLMAKSGVSPKETLAILHRIHRAIAQFETADFPLELRSPWQIQLHFDAPENKSEWQTAVEEKIETWPSWDIRIRAETPPEHYLAKNSWHPVFNRLGSKFFPALAAWMFDWKRFTWINENRGNFDDEPFSWEPKMNTLIQMAGTHLNEGDASQRQKFLELAEEVISQS